MLALSTLSACAIPLPWQRSHETEPAVSPPPLASEHSPPPAPLLALPSSGQHSASAHAGQSGGAQVFEQALPALKASAPETYVVKRGDTLWAIASRFLDTPWRWRDVWRSNPQIKNPHRIYPGDTLYKIHRNGQVSLGIRRYGDHGPMSQGGLPVVKIRPQIRYQDLSPIPVVPELLISQYANKPIILSQEAIDDAGYVLADLDGRLISAKGSKLYARRIEQYNRGNTLQVVRLGKVLKDPLSGDTLGHEATLIGKAQVRQSGDPSIVAIESNQREILPGDRLLADTLTPPLEQLQATSPAHPFEGRVVAVFDGFTRAGENQVISLNLGLRDRIKAGDVVALVSPQDPLADPFSQQDPTQPEWVALPDLNSGIAVVVRSFDKMSYALIMSSTRAIRPNDKVVPAEANTTP